MNSKFDHFQRQIDHKIDRMHDDYNQLSRKIDLYSSSNFGHMVDEDKLATFSPSKYLEKIKERGAMVNPSMLSESQNLSQPFGQTISEGRPKEFTTIASTGLD